MNLVIDVGNTWMKAAVFDEGQLIHNIRFKIDDFEQNINSITNEFQDISKCLVSSVANITSQQLTMLRDYYSVSILSADCKLPFTNTYKTPETLGVDRIALVSAACNSYPGQNVLVIDAGTCITYDFLDDKAIYHGGAISPGIRLRYRALNAFTAKLPLLETQLPEIIEGKSTAESINVGVVLGVLKEIEGFIEAYQLKYKDLTVILTGGDVKILSDQLKNTIFANSNFLLEGLNYLLNYNSKT